MMPPAPARLSTTIWIPAYSVRPFATIRATTSVLPPGGTGTTNRMGLVPESPVGCAAIADAAENNGAIATAMLICRRTPARRSRGNDPVTVTALSFRAPE
jgi:hypothetical protein